MNVENQGYMNNALIIHGLLGQYYFELDFDNPLNVLIGENGSGKTTVLRILDSIGNKDFVGLSRFMFEKLIIISEKEHFEIKYVDLIPKPEIIVNNFQGKLILDMRSDELEVISHGFNKMISRNMFYYAQFMAKCFYDEPIGEQILQYVPETCFNTLIPDVDYATEYKNSLMQLVKIDKEIKYFQGAEIETICDEFEIFFRKSFLSMHKVITLDLINNIKLLDDPITESFVKSKKLTLLNEFIDDYVNKTKNDFKIDFQTESITSFNHLVAMLQIPDLIREEFAPITNYLNEKIEIGLMNEEALFSKTKDSIIKSFTVDVNGLLTRFYYTEDFITSMNSKASQYIVNGKYIPDEKVFYTPTVDFDYFTHEVFKNIKTYLIPIFPAESLMGSLCHRIVTYYMMTDFKSDEIVAFKKFYNENIEAFIINKSEKVKCFENCVNSFLHNKKILVNPNGVIVTVDNFTTKSIGKFNLINNESNQIRLMDLSSGERKLILIFLISIFFDKATILIDEPEISISILWQEKLLDIIMSKSQCKRIIVATHSPFIINEKIIKESVITMPMEAHDE